MYSNIKCFFNSRFTNKQMGIIMMIFASFSFAVMGITVKLASGIPIYEKVFFRNLFAIFFAFYLVKRNGASLLGKKENRMMLSIRSIFGILGVITMFYGLDHIEVATAMTIKNFSQFWVLILAGFFLREKVSSGQYIFMVIALLGVIIVSKPTAPDVWFPTMISFLSSLFSAVSFIAISKLRGKEHPTTVVFYFSLVTTLMMLVPTVLQFKMLSSYEIILMAMTGISAMSGQIFMTFSYHYTTVSEVSIYAYMSIVFSAVMEIAIWHQAPEIMTVLGIGLIIVASYLSSSVGQKQDVKTDAIEIEH